MNALKTNARKIVAATVALSGTAVVLAGPGSMVHTLAISRGKG